MRARRIRALIITGLFLGVIVLPFALHRPIASVGVGFLGYTNGATGGRFAAFGFTNESGVTIRRWGGIDPDIQTGPHHFLTVNLGSDVLLARGQSEVILVPLDRTPVFTNQGAWRAVFYWTREGLRTRFHDWAATSPLVPAMLQGRGLRMESRPSEWIAP